MLNKFFNFFKGYVIIEITGKNSERFINICLRRGIDIRGVERRGEALVTRVCIRDFKRIPDIRRKTKVRIRILKKRGVRHFVKRYKKRAVFALCAVLTAAAVHESSEHIWAVEINGVKDADITLIAELLAENGIYPGADKRDLMPTGYIKNNILNKYPEISWLWVYMEGSKARVEVFELRTPPRIVDKDTPCDIVSTAEGVVKQVTVKAGDPAVSEGDAVACGDKLISGRVRAYQEGEEERYLYVHSLGTVTAYTIRTAEKDEPLYDEIRTPTGEKRRYITLEIFGKKYELFREKNTEYADYDIKTDCHELTLPMFGYMGLAMTSEKHIEVMTDRQPVSGELAVERAKNALEAEIAKTLTPLAEKTDERLEYEAVNNDTIRVKCTMSFIENIGTEELIRSEEFDQQTN